MRGGRGRIAKLRSKRGFWRNFWRSMLQILAGVGGVALYYIVFSLLFDTPYEYCMKLSSQRLRAEYVALQSRLDMLEEVIDDIEARDNNIFNIMFESSPHSLDQESEDLAFELRESLVSMSNEELSSLLGQRCDTLANGVSMLVGSTHEMVSSIEAQGRKSSKIPAIQPVVNRQLTLLTASYGWIMHPFYKTLRQHLGVDYAIPEGSRVFATADGVIKEYSLSSSASGKSVTIDHGNGYETYYAHLDKIDIPRSRRVRRGEIIGYSGNTGLSLAPHLHYEVRYKGESVDPINYFFMELNASQSQRIARIAEMGMQSFD